MSVHQSLGNNPQGLLYLFVSRQFDGQAPGDVTKAGREKKLDLIKWIHSGSGRKGKFPTEQKQQQRRWKTGSLESEILWLCLGWMPWVSVKITAWELVPKGEGEGPWDNLKINC